jgi:hypothetical protein
MQIYAVKAFPAKDYFKTKEWYYFDRVARDEHDNILRDDPTVMSTSTRTIEMQDEPKAID